MSFETSLTGLDAASSQLDVTGNNVANSATVGFKGSRAEFADIFASSNLGVSQNAIGQGVRLANVKQSFSQGQLDFTGNTLDLAINGGGFFRTSDEGSIGFTRNGAFQLDRDGFVVDAQGRRLTGFGADADGNITGALEELQVNTGNIAPQQTSELEVRANLQASATDLSALTFDETDSDTYNFSTSTTIYDSQGSDHLLTSYFRNTGSNQWEVYVDSTDDAAGPTQVADLNFGTDGQIASVTGTSTPTFSYGGGAASTDPVAFDFSNMTQFGSPFDVSKLSQDGFGAGQFSSLGVESDGRLLARFTNGQARTLGQVALSRFPAPEKLQETGDTSWVETFESGAPITGAPGSSGLGALQSGALEQSNVNLTQQLVQMITAQRNFQANSQMISTQSQITEEIINIR